MASRADMIKRARARVDARRDARRADVRDQARATYGRNLGRTKFKPTKPKVGGAGDAVLNTMREAGGNAATMLKDTVKDPVKKGIGWFEKQFNKYLPIMTANAIGRSLEEDEAASRDYGIPWFKGGNPTAVDAGSAADRYLRGDAEGLTSLIKDFPAYNEALKKDRLFTTNLDEMTDDNYEAKAGYLALLNDPSRLDKLQKDSPIRALNYMRSITGDPTNMGFDEFEAWRQAEGRTEKERGLTATQIAQKLLPQYRQQAADMYGEGFLGNTAAANYGDTTEVPTVIKQATGVTPNVIPDYGDLRFLGSVPSTEEGMAQMELADQLTPFEKYKMRSQMQERGGFKQPGTKAISDYATYLGTDTPGATIMAMQGLDPSIMSGRLGFVSPGFEEEEEEIYVDPIMKYAGYGQ